MIKELILIINEKVSNIKNIIRDADNRKILLVSFIFIISAALFLYGGEKESDHGIKNESKKGDKEIYDTYKLIWNDEFNNKKLNISKWTAKNQNFSIDSKSNNLVLISEKEFYEGGEWKIYSGLIRSEDKFYFTYGYVEMRAKVIKGNGLLSALWLTGQKEWPPEIDIIEYLGIEPDSLYLTLHCNPNKDSTCEGDDKKDKDRQLGTKYIGKDWSLDYHIYALEWTPEHVRWFIDDVEVYNITTGIPKDPMYIVLNICAHNCGDGWSDRTDETTPNPAEFYIDYVRVYKKVNANETNQNGDMIKIGVGR